MQSIMARAGEQMCARMVSSVRVFLRLLFFFKFSRVVGEKRGVWRGWRLPRPYHREVSGDADDIIATFFR